MIQIDDANWGGLIGGVLIGVYRDATGEFASGIVEPRFFQGAAFAAKEYLREGGKRVAACFEQLGVQPDEDVLCCTGFVLDGVCAWLSERGYRFRRGKITGALQELVERASLAHLEQLGFEVEYTLLTDPRRKGLLWWKQVQWLKGGDVDARQPWPERAAQCKTGWASFEIWAYHPYHEARELARAAKTERRQARWRCRWNDEG